MFTYAMAESILAQLHRAKGEAQRAAFRGRLKHLKRLGIPRGINPGRGKKVWYQDDHIFEWAFCLELAEFGIDPTVVVRIVEQHWSSDILPHFIYMQDERRSDNNDLYFGLYPKFMANAWDREDPHLIVFRFVREREVARWLGRQRRVILINVSELVREIMLLKTMRHGEEPQRDALSCDESKSTKMTSRSKQPRRKP